MRWLHNKYQSNQYEYSWCNKERYSKRKKTSVMHDSQFAQVDVAQSVKLQDWFGTQSTDYLNQNQRLCLVLFMKRNKIYLYIYGKNKLILQTAHWIRYEMCD